MQKRFHSIISLFVLILISGSLLWACTPKQTELIEEATPVVELPSAQVSTNEPEILPTATEEPSPIMVNGENIPVNYYNNEFARFRDSQAGLEQAVSDEEIKQSVLNYLFEQQLLVQGAHANGLSVSDEDLQARIDLLISELGSSDALMSWMQENHFDESEFRLALKLSMEAALMRDLIIQSVPDSVEQVRAQQIFTYTEAEANAALTNLSIGTDFNKLAWDASPQSGGELGWFPRGYLLYPEVEAAAFSLEPGTYSGVIQSEIGYHILLVLEHEAEHALTTDARLSLQNKALENWLADALANAQIVVNLP